MIKRLSALFTFALLSLTFADANAQTNVRGDVQGRWERRGSPFLVIGGIRVPDGATLTIDAGVEVRFTVNEPFEIFGRLAALGSAQDSILFTAGGGNGNWGGIRFLSPDSVSRLSYCILTLGYANRGQAQLDSLGSGGNLFIAGGDVRVDNCRISNGRARSLGGGVAVWGASPRFENCVIAGNETDLFGGGVGINLAGQAEFINCSISNNTATISGGGAYFAHGGTPRFTDTRFQANVSGRGEAATGGGVGIWNGASPRFNRCQFTENLSHAGGAAYIRGENTAPLFEWCDFINNAAREIDQVGGAVYIRGQAPAEIRYCRFTGNDANFGGAIYIKEPPFCNIHHCLFRQNGALRGGGAVATSTDLGERPLSLINCTFYRNRNTGLDPVAITGMARGDSRLFFSNCIIWDDAPLFDQDTDAAITFSNVKNGYNGEGNSAENPGFYRADSTWLLLRGDSPCRDSGDPNQRRDPDDTRSDRGWAHFPADARGGLEADSYTGETTTRQRAEMVVRFTNRTGVPIIVTPKDNWLEGVRDIAFNVTNITGDREITSAAWTADGFFIAGDNNGRVPRMYHLDRDLNLVGQFAQPEIAAAPGFQDLATDGRSVLFGADDQRVYEFTTDAELGEEYNLPRGFGLVRSLTADFHAGESPVFYFSEGAGEIVVADADVNEYARIQVPSPALNLAAKWNSPGLYLVSEPDTGRFVLNLLNLSDNRLIPLYELSAPQGTRIGGIEITQSYREGMATLVGVWKGSDDADDMLFAEALHLSWLVVVPDERLLWPGESMSWTVQFCGDQMPEGQYEGRFYITVNGWGEGNEVTARLLNRLDNAPLPPATQPRSFSITSVHPNPFNARVVVALKLRVSGDAQLSLMDVSGRTCALLHDGWLPAGNSTMQFHAHGLAAGCYYLTLNSADGTAVRPVVLIK